MIKCNGREAISILAEVQCDRHDFNDAEMKYLMRQVESFKTWLTNVGKTKQDAENIVQGILTSECKLLNQEDPFEEFIWSRQGDVGDLEIDLATALGNDFEKCSDLEFFSHQEYWDSMERTAERHEGKYPIEVWKASQEKLDTILEIIEGHKTRLSNELVTDKDERVFAKMRTRIRDLRFGKQPILMCKHWKIAMNALNELTGNQKRYIVPEVKQKTESEKLDAMDNVAYYYGLDPTYAQTGVSTDSED